MKGPKGPKRQFYGNIKSGKRSIFVIDSYLNDNKFTAVKRDVKFWTRYVKGVPFVNRRHTKGVPCSWKMVHKRVRGWTSGQSLPPGGGVLNILFLYASGCAYLWYYYINTNEIPSELSRENLISSHVKISPLLWLHNKPHLSDQKTI